MDDVLRLSAVLPGHRARIIKIVGASPFKKRLLEMGLIRGAIVTKVKLAPLADPAEYVIKGCHLSLRHQEANDIMVELMPDD